jgi:phosphocarrier protein
MSVTRDVQIVNPLGMHARPAAQLVKLASTFKSEITIGREGTAVNAKSIMGVMMLAAEQGSTVQISAEGPDAEAAVDAIAGLISRGFGEM